MVRRKYRRNSDRLNKYVVKKDLVLLEEAYNEILLDEKINWKGGLMAAVMATSPIITSCNRVSDIVDRRNNAISRALDKVGACSLVLKDKDSIADTILNKDVIVKIKKSDYLRAIYGEEKSKTFIDALPEKLRDHYVYVFSLKATKKINVDTTRFKAAYFVSTNSIHFNSEEFNEDSLKDPELINALTHEIQHSTDKHRFGRKFFGQRLLDKNELKKAQKMSPYKLNYHLQLDEMRARIAGSREYLGVIKNEQEFMQKWDHALDLLSKQGTKDFFALNKEIPSQFKQLVAIYYRLTVKNKQDFLKKLIEYALDNSIAKSGKEDGKAYA